MAAAPHSPAAGKQRVLEAAHRLFAEGCYADIGVAQILERAGVQAPTLYHHFKDKEGLYVAWAEQAIRRVGDAVAAGCRPGMSANDALCSYGVALLANLDFDIPQLLRDASRLTKEESKDRILAAYMQAFYEPLATLLVQAIATGEMRSEPLAHLTESFLGGLLALRKPGEGVETNAAQAAWWCDAFARAFKAP